MIRVAILGSDSTHTEAFGELIKDETAVLGSRAKAVSIWGADSNITKEKARILEIDRVEDSIYNAIKETDAVLIVNRFGEDRYKIAMQALEFGKPVFADKPLAMDMREARKIVKAYANDNIPLFSSSAFRFAKEVQQLRKKLEKCEVIGGIVTGPFECNDLGDDPRLKNIFFYGIHLSEILQEVFGVGIKTVYVSTSLQHGYLANVVFFNGLQISLSLVKPMKDYYSVRVFTKEESIGFTLDLEGEFYAHTLSAFFDFVEGNYPGVPLENTLESLGLLFAVEKSAQTGKIVQIKSI